MATSMLAVALISLRAGATVSFGRSAPEVVEIFAAGEKNVHGLPVVGYRIPGFLAVPSNTSEDKGWLFVFAEARKYSCSDESPHDLVGKRSSDGGKTWSANQMIVEPGVVWGASEGGKHGGAVYDPTPLYDSDTGTIHLFFSYCPSRYMSRPSIPQAFEMWQISSTDLGASWSAPVNLSSVPTPQNEQPWCQRTAGGGGNGIQLKQGPKRGRLIVPGYHNHCPSKEPQPSPSPAPPAMCTQAKGQALADHWCNTSSSCALRLAGANCTHSWLARKSEGCCAKPECPGSCSSAKQLDWRCYSTDCLTPNNSGYRKGSKCRYYCTEGQLLQNIVETCKLPATPSPPPISYSHVLYSDNHGLPGSWKYSASFQPGGAEGSLAEVGPGHLLYIARIQGGMKCTDPAISHCAGSIRSIDSGTSWPANSSVGRGQLPDPQCKNTVATTATAGLVHGGSHSVSARTNVSALFSTDQGNSWGREVMVWNYPRVGGYVAAQGFVHEGTNKVGLVFENNTCSIAIGYFSV